MRMRSRRRCSFRKSESGAAAIEFSFIAPVLALVLFGSFTFFLLFRDSTRAETATFTVADIVSRQNTVSAAFLGTVHAMFVKMVAVDSSQVGFRISSLKMANNKLTVDWSYPVSPMKALATSDIPVAKLPLVADGDSLIFVETSVNYEPIVSIAGAGSGTYSNIAANRPRFTSAIVKSDQPAPQVVVRAPDRKPGLGDRGRSVRGRPSVARAAA